MFTALLFVMVVGPAQVCDQDAACNVRCWSLAVGQTYDPRDSVCKVKKTATSFHIEDPSVAEVAPSQLKPEPKRPPR